MKKIVITQSNYIPWKGYFDALARADEFVLLDEVQFTKRDWRNRNQIKTPSDLQWLTIPVQVRGKYSQSIWETRTVDDGWKESHWKTIHFNYCRAKAYEEFGPKIRQLYESCNSNQLSLINLHFLLGLSRLLGIRPNISWSHFYASGTDRNQRLVEICLGAGATDYFTGPAAKAYLDERQFLDAGIRVHYFDYSGYPEYRQLHGPFSHTVSAIDLILNEGHASRSFLKARQPEFQEFCSDNAIAALAPE